MSSIRARSGVRVKERTPRCSTVIAKPVRTGPSTGERLDMFLWHMAVFEAALSGPYNLGANDLSLEEIELCTGLLDLCPFEPWRFPGPMSRLWSNEDLVVLTVANLPVDVEVTDQSRWALFVGGRTRDALVQLDGIGVVWRFDSRSAHD